MQHKTILTQGGMVHYFNDSYTTILWDVPMHGLSRPYEGFSYRNTAEILHSILLQENIEKTFLVGI